MRHTSGPKRRWFQFSLATLLVVVTLVAVLLGVWLYPYHRQRRAIAAIEELGGRVSTSRVGPTWLRKLVGEGLLVRVQRLYPPIIDDGLVHLKEFTHLDSLDFSRTPITGAGLVHLEGFTNLKYLNFSNTKITDESLVNLKGFTHLLWLDLSGTQITDAGLVHLRGLTNIRTLDLNYTQVTDAGLVHLKGLTDLECLYLAGTQVTDAGLKHLKGLTNLRGLFLPSHVSDTAFADLQKALPGCRRIRGRGGSGGRRILTPEEIERIIKAYQTKK